jgi:hypothetical protein
LLQLLAAAACCCCAVSLVLCPISTVEMQLLFDSKQCYCFTVAGGSSSSSSSGIRVLID